MAAKVVNGLEHFDIEREPVHGQSRRHLTREFTGEELETALRVGDFGQDPMC